MVGRDRNISDIKQASDAYKLLRTRQLFNMIVPIKFSSLSQRRISNFTKEFKLLHQQKLNNYQRVIEHRIITGYILNEISLNIFMCILKITQKMRKSQPKILERK